jgi:hypothetical protein
MARQESLFESPAEQAKLPIPNTLHRELGSPGQGIPVNFPVSKENGSHQTASSAIQSGVFSISPFASRKVLILAPNWQFSNHVRYSFSVVERDLAEKWTTLSSSQKACPFLIKAP